MSLVLYEMVESVNARQYHYCSDVEKLIARGAERRNVLAKRRNRVVWLVRDNDQMDG